MGWTRLPATRNSNPPENRTLLYEKSFYTIFEHSRKQIVFGKRPEDLTETGAISMRVWEQHQTYLKRIENFPLEKAEYYKNLKESTGTKSIRALSEITGEDWSYIARVLKTLELPEAIREFLRTHKEPSIVKHFHLRKLLELVRMEDQESQLLRFREMLEEGRTILLPF